MLTIRNAMFVSEDDAAKFTASRSRKHGSRTMRIELAEDGLFNFVPVKIDLEEEITDGLYVDAHVGADGVHTFRIFDYDEGTMLVTAIAKVTSDEDGFRGRIFDAIINWF